MKCKKFLSSCNWTPSMSCQPQPERQILWKTFQVGIPGARCSPKWALFCLFCFSWWHIIQLTPSVSCNASVIAHNWSQRYLKVHLISTWLGVGYSPVPASRTAHCPALPPSTFASTRDLSVSLWTFIMCYDFSIAGWLDREQIRILQSSLY